MILVGNQRGGAKDLALHLLKDENESVVVHDIRGFASGNLVSALLESYAISRGTKCRQHLFSLSLNPPKDESVPVSVFEDAITRAEKQLGLTGQPRAIVFHEKRGMDGTVRRHAHAVWCRINANEMKAVQLSFTKNKLNALGRELYLEHGWTMPRGFIRHEERNPRNYTLAEWQQTKRAGKDPAKIKEIFQDCWAISDSKAAFASALKEHGYILARGDRRGFVAMDHNGEAYAISRYVGIKAKQVRERLGDSADLPDARRAQSEAAALVKTRLLELQAEQDRLRKATQLQNLAEARRLEERQERERKSMTAKQAQRQLAEAEALNGRIRTGWRGLLDRLTGQRRRILAQNERKMQAALRRDHNERLNLKRHQDAEHEQQAELSQQKVTMHCKNLRELSEDIQRMSVEPENDVARASRSSARTRPKRRGRSVPMPER